ncbi:hypothetical protein TNCV_2493761 [Trichonephila clavipes]|uniref:Uncharacterized protein n=1 Tax=Trichonephila clavipes TaxID=2585209 RepID=A0A8X6RZ95_TRICX|nr:hypothetical protein TNCV_2493761 [Trichonephila clavipes]
MATGSYLTQNHSRSQSEIQGDLHKCSKGMDVCKCIMPVRHGCPLSIQQNESSLNRLVVEVEEWGTLKPGCSSKLGWNGAKSYCHLHCAQNCK